MQSANPKISVLVATRNTEKFIRGCLDSLLNQTVLNDTEIIVVNGNSRENEKKIVFQYQKRCPNIKYIFVRKAGLYHAWNVGIKASRGKYITNLNTDDRLKNDALEIMAKALNKNPDVALVYGKSYVTYKPNETFETSSNEWRIFDPPKYSYKQLLLNCICGPHPMWRKCIHNELGYFNESYKCSGDYEFWLRIAEKHKFLRLPNIIGLLYRNPNGVSLINPELASKEDLRIKLRYFNSK